MERMVCLAMLILLMLLPFLAPIGAYPDSTPPETKTTPLDTIISALTESPITFAANLLSTLRAKISEYANYDRPIDIRQVLEEYDVEKIETTQLIDSPQISPLLKSTQHKIEIAKEKKESCKFWYSAQYEQTLTGSREDNSRLFKICISKFSGLASSSADQLSLTIQAAYTLMAEDYRKYGAHGLFSPNEYSGPIQPCIHGLADFYLAFEEFNSGSMNCAPENIGSKQGLRSHLLENFCQYQGGTLSEKYNAFIGPAGIIPQLTSLHTACQEQENTQDREWKDYLEKRKAGLESLRGKSSTLQPYCKITGDDLSLLGSDAPPSPETTIGTTSTQAKTPADTCTAISTNLQSLSQELSALYPKTLPIVQRHSRITQFEEKFQATTLLLTQLSSLDKTISAAKQKARLQKDLAAAITPDQGLEPEYQFHLKKCRDAYLAAPKDPQKYFESIHHSSYLLELFTSNPQSNIASEASELLARAKTDIDLTEEQALFDKAETQPAKIQNSMYSAVIHGGHGVFGILPKAEQAYTSLEQKREHLLTLLQASGQTSQQFNEYEGYFEGPFLNLKTALGTMKEMQEFYTTKIADLEKAYRQNPGQTLSAKLSPTTIQIPFQIYANTDTLIAYEFEIENPNTFPLEKTTLTIPLSFEPKGLITDDDIHSTLKIQAGTQAKALIIQIPEIPPTSKQKAKILLRAELISAEPLKCTQAITPQLATWECTSKIEKKYDSLNGIHTFLIPLDHTLGSLLSPQYSQIKILNGNYYVETYPTEKWAATFTKQDPLTITEDSTTSLLNGLRISTTLQIKNNLPIPIETTSEHQIPHSQISEISPPDLELKGGALLLKLALQPYAEKTETFRYKINDPQTYASELLSQLPLSHSQFPAALSLYDSGDYQSAIAIALSALTTSSSTQPESSTTREQAAQAKLEEYHLLSAFLPEYTPTYTEITRLFQEGNTSLRNGNTQQAELKFTAILSFSYNRNQILQSLEQEDTKMDGRLKTLSEIQRATNSEPLKKTILKMDSAYTTFRTYKSSEDLTSALSAHITFAEQDAEATKTLNSLLKTLLKNKAPYLKTLDEIEQNIPILQQALTTAQPSTYKTYSEEITSLEQSIADERTTISSLESLAPEGQILTLSSLGKSEEEYNTLKETLYNIKARLRMALDKAQETPKDAEAAYAEGRFLDGLSILAHQSTPNPGKDRTALYLIIISTIILSITYLARDKIFPKKQESPLSRIEKKIQLRNK